MNKSERTRQRILDATASALAQRGYAATSLNAIADSIDMQAASLYYHFSSKDELVLEVLRQGTLAAREAVADVLIQLGDDADPAGALRAAIVAHLTAVLAQGPYTTANIRSYGQLPPELAARHRDEQRSYGATWRALIASGVEAGVFDASLDQRATRLLILGAMNWSIEWFVPDHGLSAEQLGHQLADTILNGIMSPDR